MIGVIEKLKIKSMMNLTVNDQIKSDFLNEKQTTKLAQNSKSILKKKQKQQNQKSFEKLKNKQIKLNDELNKVKQETRRLTNNLIEIKQTNKQLKDRLNEQEKLEIENDSLLKKNEQLSEDISKFSQMKYQKSIEKFPKKIVSLTHLKNQHNNLKIQNIHQLEGSMLNGDEVESIIGNKNYNILTEVFWKDKQFKVSWRKRTNGYKPQNSWIDGKQLDQYYSQKLFEYYKKNAIFLG